MPKIKKRRVGVKLDMTPMVDVAFLLLTFFMLTTSFKPQEAVQIVLPDSHSAFKLPEIDVMTITVSKDGRVFLGLDSPILREKLFGEEYKFKADREVNLTELAQLLREARINNPKLRTVIKADKDGEYGVIEDIMNILQSKDVNITRFNLVTDLSRDNK
ncbi:MAG: biopolymer transporter ExbD [Bacteroidota bacterium]|nr:biopolymer transporter ExbD [Bacteroidota bacterium]